MKLYVDGLLPNIRTVVARYGIYQPLSSLTFEKLVKYALDEGKTYHAQTRTFPVD